MLSVELRPKIDAAEQCALHPAVRKKVRELRSSHGLLMDPTLEQSVLLTGSDQAVSQSTEKSDIPAPVDQGDEEARPFGSEEFCLVLRL